MAKKILISFPGSGAAEADKLAGSLAAATQDSDRNVSVQRRRESSDSLDAGGTLALIIGSAAATSIAQGIAAWLARHAGTTIRIVSADGSSVDIKYGSGEDTAQIVQAALGKE